MYVNLEENYCPEKKIYLENAKNCSWEEYCLQYFSRTYIDFESDCRKMKSYVGIEPYQTISVSSSNRASLALLRINRQIIRNNGKMA